MSIILIIMFSRNHISPTYTDFDIISICAKISEINIYVGNK